MRILKAFAFVPVACVLLASSLSAQTGTGTMILSGVNGASGCFGPSASLLSIPSEECAYTSPYMSQFKNLSGPASLLPPGGGTSFGPSWDIFCVDFSHNSYIGQVTDVYLTNLGQSSGLLGTYTRSTSLRQYLEAAWLAQQIRSGLVGRTDALYMNGAIWQIMYPGSGNYFYLGSDNTGIQSWVAKAEHQWNGSTVVGVNASDWVVVTPQGNENNTRMGASQEYITQVTPEPATLLLLGTGLLATLMAAGALKRSAV